MPCDLRPCGATLSPDQDVMDDCRPLLLGPLLEGPRLVDMAPAWANTTAPQWSSTLDRHPKFVGRPIRDGSYARTEGRLFQRRVQSLWPQPDIPRPGPRGDGICGPVVMARQATAVMWEMWPPAATQCGLSYGVNALSSASASGSVGGEAAIDV